MLTGSCACGAVRYRVTKPFTTAGYCHCHRCQKRSGVPWSMSAMVPVEGFEITQGAEAVRTWRPPGGNAKSFCEHCGGHLFSGEPETGPIGVRLGGVDGDPGIRASLQRMYEQEGPEKASRGMGSPEDFEYMDAIRATASS